MHVVIDIPEDIYQYVVNTGTYGHYRFNSAKAIKNGIPLPKGHGKLIDVKDLLEEICLEDTKENRKLNLGEIITLEDIDRIEPIIEEDKVESEDQV